MLSCHPFQDEPPEHGGISHSLFGIYRTRAAQCLMLADLSRCAPSTLKTLILYTLLGYVRDTEQEKGLMDDDGPGLTGSTPDELPPVRGDPNRV